MLAYHIAICSFCPVCFMHSGRAGVFFLKERYRLKSQNAKDRMQRCAAKRALYVPSRPANRNLGRGGEGTKADGPANRQRNRRHRVVRVNQL